MKDDALHDEAANWTSDQTATDHPAGDMALVGKVKAGARARALAGLALTTAAIAYAAYAGPVESSVSKP
jgi:hypothetical protein